MSTNAYVNLDARWLEDLANDIHSGTNGFAEMSFDDASHARLSQMEARLRGIAQRIESMDAKLARHIDGSFAQGERFAELRQRQRSNVLRASRHVTSEDGETLIAAVAQAEREGRIKRAKPGESGLKQQGPETIKIDPAQSVPARRGFRLKDL